VLVAGGFNGSYLSSAELYDPGLGFASIWQPLVKSVSPLIITSGSELTASGSGFKGFSEGSGGQGEQNSSSNYPIVKLLSLANEQTLFLPVDATTGWSNTSFTSTPITLMTTSSSGFPIGFALMTVFTNGIPSQSQFVLAAPATPTISNAVSRKSHGAAGNFDIPMPLTGSSGVESRTTGGTNDYTLVVTFASNVTVTGSPQAQVTSGTGCVGTGGVCSGNVSVSGAVVTVPLTNITNAQVINVRIFGVNGASNAPATDFDFPMGFLIGDDNANRTVNAADIALCKSQLGQTVNSSNFKSDINANGSINAADVALIKGHSGTSIPQ